MAILPWWDIDAAVAEVERVHALGLRGINTNADPQNQGFPDLGDRHWDPLWEACADLGMPVNFHIGASSDLDELARQHRRGPRSTTSGSSPSARSA